MEKTNIKDLPFEGGEITLLAVSVERMRFVHGSKVYETSRPKTWDESVFTLGRVLNVKKKLYGMSLQHTRLELVDDRDMQLVEINEKLDLLTISVKEIENNMEEVASLLLEKLTELREAEDENQEENLNIINEIELSEDWSPSEAEQKRKSAAWHEWTDPLKEWLMRCVARNLSIEQMVYNSETWFQKTHGKPGFTASAIGAQLRKSGYRVKRGYAIKA